jgi:hypothetical protein
MSRIVRMLLPQPVRIGNAHRQDAAVAVDVLHRHAVQRRFVERIAALK